MNQYDIGDQVRLEVVFRSDDGLLADPTLVSCRYRRPNGMTTTVAYAEGGSLVRTGDGSYYLDVVVDVAGVWSYRWEATGAITAAAEGAFTVARSAFS